MANTVIQLKKSSTPSSVPASLEFGELAINYADGKLYYKNNNSQIAEISGAGGGGNSFGTVNANGVLVIADTPGDILTLESGANITIVGDAINDKITISAVVPSTDISPAFEQANTARTHANAAFDKANSTTYTSNVVISVADNSNAALRVTQTGTGEIVRFEDSTNPDTTPFVIDANGTILIGSSEPQLSTANAFGGLVQIIGPGASVSGLSLYANTDTATQSGSFRQHRRRTTGSVQSGDRVGIQQFVGFSGATYRNAALISADIDTGVVSDSSMPGRLVFATTSNNSSATTERMRIDASGNVGIGVTSPTSLLHVAGTANITSALTVDSIELGNSSDTTLARSSAGDVTIEGNVIYRAGGTDVPITDGGTGASDAATARTNLGLGTANSVTFTTMNAASVLVNGNSALQNGATTLIKTGYTVASFNIGTLSTGTTTLSGSNGNYQFYTNNGAHTIAAPAADTAIDVLVTNGASAGAITFSGFTVQTNGTGDTYATTNTNRYLLSVRRINGISTYLWKALQ